MPMGNVYRVVALFLAVAVALAQSSAGRIKGKVVDKDTGEPLEFANVYLIENGIVKGGSLTDEEGNFIIAPVAPGTYDIKVQYSGKEHIVKGVLVSMNETVVLEIKMTTAVELEEVEIEAYAVPLFKKDETVVGRVVTSQEVQQIATRNIVTVAALSAGTYQGDEGETPNIRGQRAGATEYFIDGVRVIGALGLPQKAIGQMQVITGGVPAEYGDLTGGVITITSSAPSSIHSIGAEVVSSQFTDPYNYNLLAFNASGPVIQKKDSAGNIITTKLGYFVNFEVQDVLDRDPPAIQITRLKPEVLEDLRQRPLVPSEDGSFFMHRGNFVKESDLEKIKYRPNNTSRAARGLIRLDYELGRNTYLKLGGNFSLVRYKLGSGMVRYLFAPESHGLVKTNTWRGYIRFQQTLSFISKEELQARLKQPATEVEGKPKRKKRGITSLYYTLQFDYTRTGYTLQDERFEDRLFEYGYVGRFTNRRAEVFELIFPEDNRHNPDISPNPYWQTAGFFDTAYYFDPSTAVNPYLANYNTVIYDYIRQNGNPQPIFDPATFDFVYRNTVYNFTQLRALGGIVNGLNTPSFAASMNIYSLFYGTGANFYIYQKSRTDQFRATGQGVLTIGNHNLKVGFEFFQRQERFYSIAAYFLWQLMRQYANAHLVQLDLNNPQPVYINGVFADTVRLEPLYDANSQSEFDKKLRAKLGLPIDSKEYINTDAYTPDFYDLSMFTADELFNAGNPIISYYGYTYLGELDRTTSYKKFFDDKINRPQKAYAPTYTAVYVEDKFELERMFFTLGLRIDRYDANSLVLKDKYLLVPAYNAKEASQILGIPLPEGVEDDWVPYVDNKNNPTRFVGFRDGDQWYDANGTPVAPELIARAGGGVVQPFVKQDSIVFESFTDYTPVVNVMPRISFSFPISDEATFFAHYDVLTQRPRERYAAFLTEYIFLPANPTVPVNNPALQPEKTIDYEVGFKQKLTNFMAISLSAYYREMRGMIQSFRVYNAYPVTYDTYENIDFGTSKGFQLELDMRRFGLVRGKIAYTLQFANGTGSSATSARNALNYIQGFSVLRIPVPLAFDQRHTITANIDFRFDDRKIRGPAVTIGGKKIYPLQKFGLNLTANIGSGTPYSRLITVNPAAVQFGVHQTVGIVGTPRGNRLPFTYRFDIRAERDFTIKRGGEGEKAKRPINFQIYVLVLNVFNRLNVRSVYAFTGLPDDSGYLSSDLGQQAIQSQFDPESFVLLYRIKERNPNFYRLPRRIRLGVQFFF